MGRRRKLCQQRRIGLFGSPLGLAEFVSPCTLQDTDSFCIFIYNSCNCIRISPLSEIMFSYWSFSYHIMGLPSGGCGTVQTFFFLDIEGPLNGSVPRRMGILVVCSSGQIGYHSVLWFLRKYFERFRVTMSLDSWDNCSFSQRKEEAIK